MHTDGIIKEEVDIVSIAFILYGLTSTFYFLNANSIETLDEELVSLPSLCLILFGVVLFLFIIIGCCAICREIPCCLEMYSILLALLATAQIGIGIFALVRFSINNEEFRLRIYDDVLQMFEGYGEDANQMDRTQEWMKCCGYNDPSDYLKNSTIPPSCCENLIENCTFTSEKVYQEGCATKLYTSIVGTNYIIGLSLLVTAVTELIGSIMGLSLSCAFWRDSRVMWI